MTVRLKSLIAIGIALFASSCGSADQSIEAQATQATTTQVPTSGPHENLASQAPLDQWGLSYRCEDGYPTGQSNRVFRADELSRAFSSPASQAQFDQVFANSQVPIEAGEPGDWHYLGDGLLIHSQPLTQDGTAFIIATSVADDPYESLGQCRLVRATGEERPVDSPFWTSEELSEPGSPTLDVQVPACVAEETLETNAVIFENQLVATLSDETGCGREPSTDVQTISIEVEASETALRIVDGSLWPFQPPGSRPQEASVELSQSSPSCTYQFAYPQVTVSWEGVPASTSGQIFLVNPPIEGSTFTVEGLEGQSPIRFAFESRLSVMFGDVEADEAPDFVIGTGVRSTPGEDVNENTAAEIRLSKNGEALTIQCQQLTPTA